MSAPLVEELVPAPDPVTSSACMQGLPCLILLDSARDPERLGRYSFLMADPAVVIRGKGTHVERVDQSSGAVTAVGGHALHAVRALLAPHRCAPIPGLPPFQGGVAGYIAYDWGAVLEQLPAPRYDDLAIPDVVFGLYDWVIAWDHALRRAWIISTGIPESDTAARATRARDRLAAVRKRLASAPSITPWNALPVPRSTGPGAPSYAVEDSEFAAALELRSSFTHRGYLDAVARVREYITAGDIFQANVSQRLEVPLCEPPWTCYQRLRAMNPAPFAAWLDFGDVRIASASPERFLRLDPDGTVEARPIKGTRPRGIYPAHDAALGRALAESAKDRAENLMIVDLLRNDLSRVCAPGTVRVTELFAIEHYSSVHHLVSTITGHLEPERDAFDLLCATFPGGSITGAPKVRAMEIIAELEPSRRGVYCGTIGYVSRSGALDTSIVIRTCLALGTRMYVSVGGGIVADSDPEQEYRETFDKARAILGALRPAGVQPLPSTRARPAT
ncbi:MAG TPA: aminodeoxychorismate synthase component I [Gemmatimonadaceae bacterium]|jgi:para-aminobenzoate synthetase component 1|nr:aminodeoxychorismate synthase component I [Gemmatimonadaceae bacterium]